MAISWLSKDFCHSYRVHIVYSSCILSFLFIQFLNTEAFVKARQSVLNSGKCIPVPEEDVCRSVCELATSKGYPCEEITVQTADGFLLGVQHIPHGFHNNVTKSTLATRPAVFLQHGLLSSAFDWVSNAANGSLAFLLADAGFDVWMGNVRGNTYSRRHVKYQPSEDKFWAWSLDEMVNFDLPAMLHHVLNVTGQDRLFYVGHSQGTMIAFAAFSQNQPLANKVKQFFALGPVTTVGHIESPIRVFAYITPELKDLFRILGVRDFMPNDDLIKLIGSSVCEMFTKFICADIIFVFAGYDPQQLNQTRLPVYIAHAPAGTSVQNMIHFGQLVRSGKFQKYDYGCADQNKKHYGQPVPPLYNVSEIRVPVYLYYGENDWLADSEDVHGLMGKLRNLQGTYEVPKWDHLDFTWGMDAASQVYHPIINIMKQYEEQHAREH